MFKSFIELVVEQSPRVHAIYSSHNPIRCAGLYNPTLPIVLDTIMCVCVCECGCAHVSVCMCVCICVRVCMHMHILCISGSGTCVLFTCDFRVGCVG